MSAESVGKKIRRATLQKVPYMAIMGDKEIALETISIRKRSGDELGSISPLSFIDLLLKDIENHS
jgi:threonyl-tRNA synthetase